MRIFAIFFTLVLWLPASALSNDFPEENAELIPQWQALEQRQEYKKLFDSILSPTRKGDFLTGMNYLRRRILEGAYDPRYHISYAQMLWHIQIKDTSALMAAASILILETNKARCNDNTAGESYIGSAMSALRGPLLYWQELSPEKQKDILGKVFYIEEKIKARPPDRLICITGMKAMSQSLEMVEKGKIEPLKVPSQENLPGTTYLIPESPDIKIEYLNDVEWTKERIRIRKNFLNSILGKTEN